MSVILKSRSGKVNKAFCKTKGKIIEKLGIRYNMILVEQNYTLMVCRNGYFENCIGDHLVGKCYT